MGTTTEHRVLRPPPARTVHRPAVDRLLDADEDDRLTVVAAGAGWGKTTAVASWAAEQPGPVAWVALEPRDTVPQALASRVLEALRGSGAVPPGHELARLRVPPTSTPGFVTRWVQGLASLPAPATLVLDDLDVLRHRTVVQSVRDLLATDVPLRLVLLRRAEPPVAHRRATRLVAEDLAFTAADVRALADLEGVEISPQEARHILARTRGWPTGVRIAVARLARRRTDGDPEEDEALADDRDVADYLVGEVIDRQPPAVRSFLLRHGDPVAALDHAAEAEHWDLLGRVLAEAAAPLLVGPGREAVREALVRLPYDELPPGAWSELCAAALAHLDRAYPACQAHLVRLRALLLRAPWPGTVPVGQPDGAPPTPAAPGAADVLTELLDAASARGTGDVVAQERAATVAEDALGRVAWPFPAFGGYLRSAHDLRGHAMLWRGDAAGARRELTASVAAQPDVVDLTSLSARAGLGLAHVALGQLDAAEREARAAVDLAAGSGWTSYSYVRPAYAALAWVALLRGRWAEADRAVAYGFAASEAGSDPVGLAALHALQVLVALSRGRVRAAAAAAASRTGEPVPPLVAALRLRGEVELETVAGAAPAAANPERIASPLEALVAGRRALVRGDLGATRRHARAAAGWAEDLRDPLTETEAYLLLAEASEPRRAVRRRPGPARAGRRRARAPGPTVRRRDRTGHGCRPRPGAAGPDRRAGGRGGRPPAPAGPRPGARAAVDRADGPRAERARRPADDGEQRGDRGRAGRLGEHREGPPEVALPQARGPDPPRRRGARP
jgi:LuxR family maltose regulon positive regulatory protein